MKRRIIESDDTVRTVVHKILSGADINTVYAMGNFENIYRNLRRYRETHINPKPFEFEIVG